MIPLSAAAPVRHAGSRRDKCLFRDQAEGRISWQK